MGKIKDQFFTFFNFTKRETKGLLVLLIALAFVLLLPSVQNYFTEEDLYPSKKDQAYLDSITEILLQESLSDSSHKIDPNKLSYFQWMDLGVSSDLANDILRAKRKQKEFNCIDEIKAVKGVNTSKLVNYFSKFSLNEHCQKPQKKIKVYKINSVTKKQLINIPGISSKEAQRILSYRKKLGGFYAWTQLKEVSKLSNSDYDKLKTHLTIRSSPITKIKINRIKRQVLKRHPYLTAKQSSTIINYRKKIKRYDNMSQFKKVYGITAKEVKKIQPYLSFE